MKPRTEREREVMRLHASLPAITKAQKEWAIDHCFDAVGYICKGIVWFLVIGGLRIDVDPISIEMPDWDKGLASVVLIVCVFLIEVFGKMDGYKEGFADGVKYILEELESEKKKDND